MSDWRVILTDSESLSGVAPTCPEQTTPNGRHDLEGPDEDDETARYDLAGVYDCCPKPHIECFGERTAELIAGALNQAEAEVCP